MTSIRRHPRTVTLAAAAAAAALLVVACSKSPTEPEYFNPFDPAAPGYNGNPLHLSVSTYNPSTGDVTLLWTHPDGYGITRYEILQTTSPSQGYNSLGILDAPSRAPSSVTFAVSGTARNALNYFLVLAYSALGDTMAISTLTPALYTVPPLLRLASGATTVPSRHARLTVLTDRGDSVFIADNLAFAAPARLGKAARLGVLDTVMWDFGPRAQGDTLRLYLKVETGGVPSLVDSLRPRVNFAPALGVAGDPPTVADNVVDLTVDTVGVVQMRFALAEADLPAQPWEVAAPVHPGFELSDALATQTIYGEFEGDFGVFSVRTKTVTPDDLSDVSLAITGLDPGDPDRVLDVSAVPVACNAVATEMRFAAVPNFAGSPWLPYAATAQVDVGEGSGYRVIYGQFRNHWTTSGVVTDWFTQVSRPLEITILAPPDGSILRGGTTLQVRGISRAAADSLPVESVQFFADGMGDWQDAAGVANWSYVWEIPTFTEDTGLTLRARAITAEAAGTAERDTATVAIAVTVTQLLALIASPLADAQIAAGAAVVVAGTTVAALDGAPVDSVVVVAGMDRLKADGTETWTVNWSAPDVSETTPVTIQATAHAAAETATSAVNVTVEPSGR